METPQVFDFTDVPIGEPLGPVIKLVKDEEFGPSFPAFREFKVFGQTLDSVGGIFRTDVAPVTNLHKLMAFEFNLVNIGEKDCMLANRWANPDKFDTAMNLRRLKGLWGVTLTEVETDQELHSVVGSCLMSWDAVRVDDSLKPKFGGYATGISAGFGARSSSYFGNLIDVTGYEGKVMWADFTLFPTGEFPFQDSVRVKIKMEGNSIFRCEATEVWPGGFK